MDEQLKELLDIENMSEKESGDEFAMEGDADNYDGRKPIYIKRPLYRSSQVT